MYTKQIPTTAFQYSVNDTIDRFSPFTSFDMELKIHKSWRIKGAYSRLNHFFFNQTDSISSRFLRDLQQIRAQTTLLYQSKYTRRGSWGQRRTILCRNRRQFYFFRISGERMKMRARRDAYNRIYFVFYRAPTCLSLASLQTPSSAFLSASYARLKMAPALQPGTKVQ